MNVTILQKPENPIKTLFTAARTCYTGKDIKEIFADNKSEGDMLKLVQDIIASGHHSVLEHISFTFGIDGISRATSHQLVRHRVASYSQQSQRYVANNNPQFITPPTIFRNPEALTLYNEIMLIEQKYYSMIKETLNDPVGIEDARYVLGNGYATNVTMTLNLRELMHVCHERLCNRAQWEIRMLFGEIRTLLYKEYPWMVKVIDLDAKCALSGYCPESKERTCGRKPIKG